LEINVQVQRHKIDWVPVKRNSNEKLVNCFEWKEQNKLNSGNYLLEAWTWKWNQRTANWKNEIQIKHWIKQIWLGRLKSSKSGLVALNQANQAWSPKLNFVWVWILQSSLPLEMKRLNLSFTSWRWIKTITRIYILYQ